MRAPCLAVLGLAASGCLASPPDLADAHPPFRVPEEDPSLPTALELCERHVELTALGEVIARHDSVHLSGLARIPEMGIEGDFEAWRARPARSAVRIWLPSMGELAYGCDGAVAWTLHPVVGPQLLEGATLVKARSGALYDQMLRRPEGLETYVTTGVQRFGQEECYEVFGMFAEPANASARERSFREYYSVESGLLVGLVEPSETSEGLVDVTRAFADYQRMGDGLVARVTVQRSAGVELVLEVQSVEYDVLGEGGGDDDDPFARPVEIERMLAP